MASFLLTAIARTIAVQAARFSSLSESGFIPTGLKKAINQAASKVFSSLSESGFIPTTRFKNCSIIIMKSSHLFQRVASFLL